MATNYKDMTAMIGYIRYNNMLNKENENAKEEVVSKGFLNKPQRKQETQEDSVLYIMRNLRESMRKV